MASNLLDLCSCFVPVDVHSPALVTLAQDAHCRHVTPSERCTHSRCLLAVSVTSSICFMQARRRLLSAPVPAPSTAIDVTDGNCSAAVPTLLSFEGVSPCLNEYMFVGLAAV